MKDFFEVYADRIDRRGPDECWEWIGTRSTAGYGNFGRDGRRHTTHRCAYEAANGAGSASGLVVRHRCDNPPCVNPGHLLIGTHKDNMRDAAERRRFPDRRGARSYNAALTESDVTLIRQMAADGMSICEIARAHPACGRQGIDDAVRGKRWAHLPGAVPNPRRFPVKPPRLVGSEHPRAALTESDVVAIRARLAGGETCTAIGADFGVSRSTIGNIRHGKTWTHV